MEEKEVWNPVRFYENRYEVSNYGRIRSLKTKTILKPIKRAMGKFYIALSGNGYIHGIKHGRITSRIKVKNFEVGLLVAHAFHRTSHLNERHVRHLNGNPIDNHSENVIWSERGEI